MPSKRQVLLAAVTSRSSRRWWGIEEGQPCEEPGLRACKCKCVCVCCVQRGVCVCVWSCGSRHISFRFRHGNRRQAGRQAGGKTRQLHLAIILTARHCVTIILGAGPK